MVNQKLCTGSIELVNDTIKVYDPVRNIQMILINTGAGSLPRAIIVDPSTRYMLTCINFVRVSFVLEIIILFVQYYFHQLNSSMCHIISQCKLVHVNYFYHFVQGVYNNEIFVNYGNNNNCGALLQLASYIPTVSNSQPVYFTIRTFLLIMSGDLPISSHSMLS